ncbi:MAG TPA: winged helix-turn-helix domain-containing protein [Thermoanaerobaculia bacterium]|jgi:DNA-binding winged helix-turn-helix (wHTH) protein|nr:winged helix-turn-helix domain-containing protein [Thermoanaerobaculia bacterium]
MASETSRPRFRFGELVLSPGRRLLLRAGEPVALPPRYLDLLLLLIGERHRVVEREEIHQLVWGGVAVTDGAFTQAVRTVRRALGDDDPREPRFIRTAARHGYQFVFAPVVEEDDAAPLDERPRGAAELTREAAPASATGVAEPDAVGQAPSAVVVSGWLGGALGAGTAGVVASLILGSLLILAGGGHWPLLPVLCVLGAGVGVWGGGAVGAGIALGASRPRGRRGAIVLLGATAGALAGAVGHQLVGWTMSELLGRPVTALGGALEGVVLGGAVSLALALTWNDDRAGRTSLAAVLAAALCGAVAAGLLAAAGARLAGISLDAIADALKGARILAPLGTYLGEPPPVGQRGAGPATRLAVSLLEGGFFGAGMAWGLGRLRVVQPSRVRFG